MEPDILVTPPLLPMTTTNITTKKKKEPEHPYLPAPFTSYSRYDAAIHAAINHQFRLPSSVRNGPKHTIPTLNNAEPLTREELDVATRILRDRKSAAISYQAVLSAESSIEPLSRSYQQQTSKKRRIPNLSLMTTSTTASTTPSPSPSSKEHEDQICCERHCTTLSEKGRVRCKFHLQKAAERKAKSRSKSFGLRLET